MAQDKELEIKLGFLDEAQEYLDRIESGLLGLSTGTVDNSCLDTLLRATHSLKGGSAMMGFENISYLAHRLEDFFKVLRGGKEVVKDTELERLFLASVDGLRHLLTAVRNGVEAEQSSLEIDINSLFEQLYDRLGESQAEDATALLSEEVGEDVKVLLFETEVEGCLQRLEAVLEHSDKPCLLEEFLIVAQELGGLGEMLELPDFTSLCNDIVTHLQATPEEVETIAEKALQEWRRSQAMVLIGSLKTLPNHLELTPSDNLINNLAISLELEIENNNINQDELEPLLESGNLAQEILDVVLPTPKAPIAIPSPRIQLETTPHVSKESEKTIRVSIEQIEQLSDLFGQLTIERNGLDLHLKRLRTLLSLLTKKVKTLEQSNFRLRTAYDKTGYKYELTAYRPEETLSPKFNHQFDLLEMDRYSDLQLLSGEVMETIVQIQEIRSDLDINLGDTERTTKDLNRTAKMMQTNLTQVRMRPLSDLIGRFPRAIRDMALQYGKVVELKLKGGSTLIDKIILEALNEPLLHLLRNAFDHGIEDPTTRSNLGKPEKGVIEITGTYRGNQTVITISDDGSGISIEKIRTKALQMGLKSENILKFSDKELLDLIFEPGFSTAEKVSDLSGRGVGMDIVRTNLRRVRGEIYIDTKPGSGTTFTITVPFTLSVLRVLLVESEGMMLAFPTNSVEEMLLLQEEMIISSAAQEVLNWEGFMLPLIRLGKWLDFSSHEQMFDTEAIPLINQPIVLMISSGDDLVGIQVDRYWGEQEVTIRQIEGNLKMPPGFSGCTILGDGRVVPLIDCLQLLASIENDQVQFNMREDQLPSESSIIFNTNISPDFYRQLVMVVDDSINVRRFLALTLEKAGYRVEQAKDGQEAIEKLQAGSKTSFVICDIEMPRLDGFGFLAHVKSIPGCQNLPVIMLTSRSGDKHRQLAMNLGATAYFSKPFKEQELLQTLEQLNKQKLSMV